MTNYTISVDIDSPNGDQYVHVFEIMCNDRDVITQDRILDVLSDRYKFKISPKWKFWNNSRVKIVASTSSMTRNSVYSFTFNVSYWEKL